MRGRHTTTITQPSGRLFELPQTQFTSDDFYTPPWIFETMGLRFDIDVATPPGGVPWVPADRHYDQAADGLGQPWAGRVWMNPPFSNTGQWTDRFVDHGHGVALLQISNSRYTHRVWRKADGIVVVPEQIAFVVSDDVTGGDTRYRKVYMPCWLVAFGDECVDGIGRIGSVRRA